MSSLLKNYLLSLNALSIKVSDVIGIKLSAMQLNDEYFEKVKIELNTYIVNRCKPNKF